MIKNPNTKQNGATLIVALIMLLIITILAVGSMREVTLESRITANTIEQKRLLNLADSGLREAERRFNNTFTAQEPGEGCELTNKKYPCLVNLAALGLDINVLHADPREFDKIDPSDARAWMPYIGSDIDNPTILDPTRTITWNSIPIPSGEQNSEALNPEYGNLMRGEGTFFYATNSRARATTGTEGSALLQSTVARVYTSN
ncbi:PilX N-terminal domain-containing pilus assembly protein [Pseudomonas sp. NPDC079086]|jgi:type IV pilus assembly protein PilX|uniref:pilus assembly PilX family protein n=1 Tax=unclassified Pseudomonas TaxID=196821 RepID=UPI0037C92AB5